MYLIAYSLIYYFRTPLYVFTVHPLKLFVDGCASFIKMESSALWTRITLGLALIPTPPPDMTYSQTLPLDSPLITIHFHDVHACTSKHYFIKVNNI